ncbi:FAD-dependent oxidoreductase [Leisingera methylohalidivorans]|uniref:Aminomethyl transferase n=1 Tax=Leisingera methylohalidivorans DSM 14336 TaxID=999552 RepID=V9VUH8_9RHOB|nr:FAD-dependent oxidoreductase [Leisingera methylohalidivorans]AHD02391.1 aminomethyl transferase [Leisingera methylohalidivorans DSM 14336]
MQSHAKVVIAGGGMMGVGLAYHLAEEGWKDVVLIEKGELTSGSTWHAAGQCPSFIGNYNMAKIHHYSNTLYPRLEEITGQPAGWHGCGGIRLATTQEEVDWFNYVAGFSANVGFHMEVIGPSRIKELNPWLETDGILAGAWTNMDGHVDPSSACNAMAAGARRMGAAIIRRNRVTDIRQLPSGEWQVVTEQGSITCEHVVNAGGCYAREVGLWVGLDTPITNMEHHYLVTEALDAFKTWEGELPVMRDPATAGYYRQEQKSGLVGIYEHYGAKEAWGHRGGFPEWGSENELFEGDIDRIAPWLEQAFERMPVFAEAGIKRIINGAIPHTPDGNPLAGPAPGLRNFWQCCGSSIGIAQGAGVGKYLAQWMVHGDSEINMACVDPRRFGGFADQAYTRAKSFEDYHEMFVTPLPGREAAAGRDVRTTPLYEPLKAKGAVYSQVFGWERPKYFAPEGFVEDLQFRRNNTFGIVAGECRAVRQRVGICDLSSFAKFDVTGPGAEALLHRLTANKLPKKQGGITLTHVLSGNGRIIGEWTITRLADDRFYVLTGAGAELQALDQLSAAGEDVAVTNVTDDFGMLVVAGPKARDVLQPLTEADLSTPSFRWLSGQEITIAGVALRALRVNYVGELGWELHAPMTQLAELYSAIWQAGEPHGISDFGLHAVNSLRMEKAYHGMNTELTSEITLIEAGSSRFYAPDKGAFQGRAATELVRQQGIATKLVYGEVDADNCDIYGGEPVMQGDKVVGVCTSGGFGHATGKSLGFAYVDPEAAGGLEVVILGERKAFTLLDAPVWDPTNERQKA